MSPAVLAPRLKPQNRIRPSADAYVALMQHDIGVFTSWLSSHGLKGYIGEFGMPAYDDSLAFARFTEAFYETVATSGVDVWMSAWLASEYFPNHVLAAYTGSNFNQGQAITALNSRTMFGRVIEQHKGPGRGVNLGNSGENAAPQVAASSSTFSNSRDPATLGTGGALGPPASPDTYSGGNCVANQWGFGTQATWQYLGARGVQLVRLPFRAERIYRTFNSALDTTTVAAIQTVLGYAAGAGIQVILDCHNFGLYYLDNGTQGVSQALGGTTWTSSIFADMWTRIVAAFDSYPALAGYELMNEPAAATNLQAACNAAIAAIRSAGSTKTVLVAPKTSYSNPTEVAGLTPWVVDPGNNFRYVSHYYADYATGQNSSFGSSTVNSGGMSRYASNLNYAKTNGYSGIDTSPTVSTGGVSDSFDRPALPFNGGCSVGATDDNSHAFWENSINQVGYNSRYQGDGSFDWWIPTPGQVTNYNASSSAMWVQTGKSDCTITVPMPTVGSASGGLWFRGTPDGGSGLAIDIGGIYSVTRSKTGPPTFATLASWSSPGYASGDTLQAVLSGTTVTAKRIRSGVTTVLGTATTSFNETQTCHGLWCYAVSTPRTTWAEPFNVN